MAGVVQKVSIKNARFYSPIGFYDEEQLLGNEFFVDVNVYFMFANPDSDLLENTINYEELYQLVTKVMVPKRKLIESAVEDILNSLIEEYSFVTRADVTIKKKNPPFGGDLAESEVSLFYQK